MGIRDQEIQRLLSYAKGLGVKVSFRQAKDTTVGAAEWYVDGSQINVYTWEGQPKTMLVLNIIHELGHHLHWIKQNRKPDEQIIDALLREENKEKGTVIDKKYRKLIYEDELEGMKYHDEIVKNVDIKVKPSIIEANKKLDAFIYQYYYETGKFPATKLVKQKLKEFKNESK
jgi:hypothetical protein